MGMIKTTRRMMKIQKKILDNLVEAQHSVEAVQGAGVKVLHLSRQAGQASEVGHKIAGLHPSSSFRQPSSSRAKHLLSNSTQMPFLFNKDLFDHQIIFSSSNQHQICSWIFYSICKDSFTFGWQSMIDKSKSSGIEYCFLNTCLVLSFAASKDGNQINPKQSLGWGMWSISKKPFQTILYCL